MRNPIVFISGIIAESTSREDLVTQLEHAIRHFRQTGDFDHIYMVISLIQQKRLLEKLGSVEKLVEAFDQFQSIKEVFDHTQNKQ